MISSSGIQSFTTGLGKNFAQNCHCSLLCPIILCFTSFHGEHTFINHLHMNSHLRGVAVTVVMFAWVPKEASTSMRCDI